MSLILGIESSTKAGSVALVEDGKEIGSQHYNLDKSHSSLLHVMIEQLLSNVGVGLKDVDAIALSEGPGSYTGLRIGTSSAKGLCYALDIPLIAVNTLEAMAFQIQKVNAFADLYLPMIDARRMEVYTMMLNAKGEVLKETEPVIIDDDSYKGELENNKVLFFGDGAFKCKGVINSINASFLEDINPSAVEVAQLAFNKFEKQEFENVIAFEPFYLKEFRLATAKKS